jgi:hypothetical protein
MAFFTTSSANNIPDASMDKWLPVNGLNATFSNILLTPSVYQLNLESFHFHLPKRLKLNQEISVSVPTHWKI